MRMRLACLVLACAPAFGQYAYDFAQSPVAADGHWTSNGGPSFTPAGVTFSTTGSLIYTTAVSGASRYDYEIHTTLALKSGGGTYIHFLRADSQSDTAGTGNYASAELAM